MDDFFDFPATDRVSDRWYRHADRRPDAAAVIHWSAVADPVWWTWRTLVSRAERVAAGLAAAGVRPGHVAALIARHHPDFYPTYLGVELAGAIPAVLAYPNPRLHPDKFRQGLAGMARRSGLDWVLTERDLEPVVRDLAVGADSTIKGLLFPFEDSFPTGGPVPAITTSPDDPCLLQHSSGTTGLQKAVVLSHRAVLGHLRRYAAAIDLTPDDRVVSWLPLYHDMGLIAAFHLPLAFGIPVVQLDPFEWVQAPALFLDAASRERATLAWLPNFAFHLMADRVADEDLEGVRLDGLRMVVNCSEPVRAEAFAAFGRRYGRYGFRSGAAAASYAMAETTFALTQTPPGHPPPTLSADREALAAGRFVPVPPGPAARACVSSGPPIADAELRVVNESGVSIPPGQVGEILARTPSLFDGYRNAPDLTAAALADGWYRTGDYGFEHAGEWYVIGRKKDVIIVAGKNIYPEDVEDAVQSVPGLIPGRVMAFGLDDPTLGTEQVAVVAESAAAGGDGETALRRAVVDAGAAAGIAVARVFLVPPRWLIKSSAGKPSRKANRDRILSES